jgi:sensor histidine kinase YesM
MNTGVINSRFSTINLVLVPPAILAVNYIFFKSGYFSSIRLFAIATITTAIVGFINSEIHFLQGNYLRKKYPGFEQSTRRIITWSLFTIPVTPVFITALFYIYRLFILPGYSITRVQLYWAILAGFIIDVLFLAFNEGIYTFGKWKENIREAEQLKKANLQTQFESLKNQVNPHFLFNSINTLSSLIHEDKERAVQFIDEMSNVYRYLLRNNEEELVSLSTELKFIHSYFHLLKTRYGNGIEMKLNIDEKTQNYLLPPLTLQLLVENAVKHNNVLKEKPLVIEICTPEAGRLIVKNNLQKKTITVDSSKIGLNNIKEKFRLLEQPDVVVKETAAEFIVVVPLLEALNKT